MEVKRYSIKPVLKTDENGNQYAAFEYVENPSGMCVFYGDSAAALKEKDRELSDTKAALAAAQATIAANAPILAQAAKSVEDAQGTIGELRDTVKRMREALILCRARHLGCVESLPVGRIIRIDNRCSLCEKIDAALADPAPEQGTEGEQS